MTLFKAKIRTGTKLTIVNWAVALSIVIFLNIVLPLLSLFLEDMSDIMSTLDISKTTIALLTEGAVFHVASEFRKAKENTKG